MIKRPLLFSAMLLAFLVAVLYRADPGLFLPDVDFTDKERIILTGAIYRLEKNDDSIKIYLKHACAGSFSGNTQSTVGKAVLIMSEEEFTGKGIRTGNTISSDAVFRSFSQARNFGNFDERQYYHSMGVFLKAHSSDTVITDTHTDVIGQFLFEFRNRLAESIRESVSDPEIAGIMISVCTGDRSGLSEETRILFRRSGIAHVLAISGLHISVLGMGIFRLLRRKFRFLISASVSVLMVAGFCVMTGMSGSGIRAAIMFLLSVIAIGLGKNYDILCSLSLAVIVLLVSEPLYIINSGFQLSVMAIFSIGYLYKPLEMFFLYRQDNRCRRVFNPPENCFGIKVISGFLLSLSITLGTLPVTASLYYEIPLYSILINLLIIPLLSAALGAGLISAVTGIFNLAAGRFFAGIGVYTAVFIQWVCQLFQSLPGSSRVVGQPSAWNIAVYYLLLFAGARSAGIYTAVQRNRNYPCKNRNDPHTIYRKTGSGDEQWFASEAYPHGDQVKRHPAFTAAAKKAAAAAAVAAVALIALFLRVPSGNVVVTFLDMDQGECILIESPSGRVYMIDSGSVSVNHAAQYRAVPAIKFKGISHIDYAIVTHPDADHYNSLLEIMENTQTLNISIDNLLIPYVPENENYDQLVTAAQNRGIKVTNIHSGMVLADGFVRLSCLHPAPGFISSEVNDYSAVIELEFDNFSALFTGDISEEVEKQLIGKLKVRLRNLSSANDSGLYGYNLLKVAHHGSRFSSSTEFLNTVSPQVAVISAGVDNVYGHPHDETLNRLTGAGASVFITSQSGEVIVETDTNACMRIKTKLG